MEDVLIGMFPLNLVVFVGDTLNLHIFEPRYRQLVADCRQNKAMFGIPPFINKKLCNHGTYLKITKIEREYEDGRLDIVTEAIGAFKIKHFENPLKGKLYAGGTTEILEYDNSYDIVIQQKIIALLQELEQIIEVKIPFDENKPQPLSFQIGHKIGLSMEQEYQLLITKSENERQHYIIDHLETVIPIVTEVERAKKRIAMNGHFKKFDALDF